MARALSNAARASAGLPAIPSQAAQRKARGYVGLSKLRKTFKRMEPTIQHRIRKQLEAAGWEVMVDAIMFARMQDLEQTGDLIRSIDFKVGSDGSTVVIGPGAAALTWQRRPWDNTSQRAKNMSIKQKAMKWNFFKGYWGEFGTAGEYPQPARPFMNSAWESNAPGIRIRLGKAVADAVRLTSEGR